MGTYEVSIPRHKGQVTRAGAIRRAMELAEAERIHVTGTPRVRVKHSPIPIIGPRRAYLVTFRQATRGETLSGSQS